MLSVTVTFMKAQTINSHLRFNLTFVEDKDKQIVAEFRAICMKNKKRYSKILASLMKDYIDTYKATR
jgi:hypothetical protein